jgi:hypothetical protein
MINPKIDHAVTVALEAIRDAAPGLLTMTEVAEKVASHADVTTGTARNWLRKAIEAGDLLELTPWSRRFVIELPGADTAGVGPFYVGEERTGTSYDMRRVITTDDTKRRPSSYGPGRTTYMADPQQIREYVQQLADEKTAKQEAEREASRAEKKAQAKEISCRFPGLQRSLRTLRLLGTEMREPKGRFAAVSARAHLENAERRGEVKAIEDRDTSVTIHAWGDENAAVLRAILEAGISAYVASQPMTHCAHCAERILLARQDEDAGFWWHVATAITSCGKDRDTKAEPADVPRETDTES